MIGLVLQARMGSSRLPGKVMMEICGRPMLGHILDRLLLVEKADITIVATSIKSQDDVIENFASEMGIACFRGDENDVLDRYYQTMCCYDLRHIVRVTADNPFVDPEEIDHLIDLHLQSSADYTSAFGHLPVGIGAECFTAAALELSWREGTAGNHREHVNEFIQEQPGRFHLEELPIAPEKQAPALRLTVDTPEDFARAEKIYQALHIPGCCISTSEAIWLCAA